MRKKYWIALITFLLFCIACPFIIEGLYNLGDEKPLIITNYSQSDVLEYVATVIGALISMIALFTVADSQKPHFVIKHSLSENEDGIAVYIELINTGFNDYEIQSFDICDKAKHKSHAAIANLAPFVIKGNSSQGFFVTVSRIKRLIKSITKTDDAKNIVYAVRLSINNTIYLSTGDLSHYLSIGGKYNGSSKI